jgi:hypothetical protein
MTFTFADGFGHVNQNKSSVSENATLLVWPSTSTAWSSAAALRA